MSTPDVLSDLFAAAADLVVPDDRGIEWRVRRLTPEQAVRARVGLRALVALQNSLVAPAEAVGEEDAQAEERAALLAAKRLDPETQADVVSYRQRIAMAGVYGVRRKGDEAWTNCILVEPGRENKARGHLPISAVPVGVIAEIADAAMSGATLAAEEVTHFPE